MGRRFFLGEGTFFQEKDGSFPQTPFFEESHFYAELRVYLKKEEATARADFPSQKWRK